MVKADLGAREQAIAAAGRRSGAFYLIVLAALGLVLAGVASLKVWTIYVWHPELRPRRNAVRGRVRRPQDQLPGLRAAIRLTGYSANCSLLSDPT